MAVGYKQVMKGGGREFETASQGTINQRTSHIGTKWSGEDGVRDVKGVEEV